VGYHSHRLWLLLLLLCMEMWGREAIGNPRSPSTLHWSRLCVVACGVSHILFLHLELFPLRIVPESPAYPSNARAPSSISDVNERTRRNLWLLISVFLVSVVFAYHAVSRLRSDIHFEREDGDYRRDVVGDIIHENAFIARNGNHTIAAAVDTDPSGIPDFQRASAADNGGGETQ
jgi:hypothetical protein